MALYGGPDLAPVHTEIEPTLGNPAVVKVGGTRAATPAGYGRCLAAHVRRSSQRRRPAARHNHRAPGNWTAPGILEALMTIPELIIGELYAGYAGLTYWRLRTSS
jgi:hypothetical protein